MNFIQRVQHTIKTYRLATPGDKIIVAVSGGADSIALLHVLTELRHELGIQLHIAHINHKLRRGSDLDQRFAEKTASRLNLPCTSIALKGLSKKKSVEEQARKLRFESLIKIGKQKKAQAIALGHTQDDLAETALMRILRGTGMAGMQAILPKRKINGFYFIRPLLETQRGEIEKYLKAKHVPFKNDPSNKNTKFYRNKVRRNLLPILEKEYNANIKELLANLSNTIAADYDFLQSEAGEALKQVLIKSPTKNKASLKREKLQKLHPSLQRILIRMVIAQLKGNTNRLTLRHILEIEDLLADRPNESVVNLPGGISAKKEQKILTLSLRSS